MVTVDIKITWADLYDYMLRHTYNSASGLLGSGLGAVCVITALSTKKWIFLIAGIILLIYLPWTLYIKSRQQALANPSFQSPLHYVLDEEGITVSQGDVTESQKWEDMVKAVSTGRSYIVYTSRSNATIFPKAQLGDSQTAVVEMISKHMPAKKVNIRM